MVIEFVLLCTHTASWKAKGFIRLQRLGIASQNCNRPKSVSEYAGMQESPSQN